MLDTLKPPTLPVRRAIMCVRCEERPKALSSLDFKDEDLTDIIKLYYKVDYCIQAFQLFTNIDHLPETVLWDVNDRRQRYRGKSFQYRGPMGFRNP